MFNKTEKSNEVLDLMMEQFKNIKYLVIDTLNGLMVAEEMRILAMQGGDKRSAWTDLAQNGWALINKALTLRKDLTVIILCHSETISDDNGIIRTRIKTNGRKLEKLVLESKMSTVVWAVRQDGKYKFILYRRKREIINNTFKHSKTRSETFCSKEKFSNNN